MKLAACMVTLFVLSSALTSSSSSIQPRGPLHHHQQPQMSMTEDSIEDYDDFSEIPKFLRWSYNIPRTVSDSQLVDILLPKNKRYRK